MDYLWTPWRYAYVTIADKPGACVLCEAQRMNDHEAYIVHRAQHCYIVLNRYPYTSGHSMIVPYQHLDKLENLPWEAAQEMMALSQKMAAIFRRLYHPDGINLGMNQGRSAGAGIADHLHMHVLPRWVGDSSFLTTVSETRVIPESLEISWERIRAEF